MSRLDQGVDFEWRAGDLIHGMSTARASATWQGLVRALDTAETSLFVKTDGGVRLWVDGVNLLDTWNASSSVRGGRAGGGLWESTGNVSMIEGRLYSIRLDYSHEGGAAHVSLSWGSVLRPRATIPASSMLWREPLGPLSSSQPTHNLLVRSAPASASLSAVKDYPMSPIPAGLVTFSVDIRDVYNNSRGQGGDTVSSTLVHATTSVLPSAVEFEDLGSGVYRGRAITTVPGAWTLSVLLGGSTHVSSSPVTVTVTHGPFVANASLLVGNGAPGTGGGGFRMTRGIASLFVIHAKDVYGNAVLDEDASLVGRFSAAIRLGGVIQHLCAVKIASSSSSGSSGGIFDVSCSYNYPGEYELDVRHVDSHIPPSPVTVFVLPGGTCASRCALSGSGLTLATSGTAVSVTITAKDSLGTLKAEGGDQFSVSLRDAASGVLTQGTSVVDHYLSRDALGGTCADAASSTSDSYVAGPLTVSMTGISTTVDFSTEPGSPPGVAIGSFLKIGLELVKVTGVANLAANSFVVSRGEAGTTALSHAIGAIVWVAQPQCSPGSYTASYSVTRSGTYTLSVLLGGIHGLPSAGGSTIKVMPGAVCATTSYARGSGLTLATAGTQARYTVYARDAYGNNVTTLGGKMLSFSIFDGVIGVVASGVSEPASEVGEDVGVYHVAYTAQRGHHSALLHDIEIDGDPISGSMDSTNVLVVQPPIVAELSTMASPASPLTAGDAASFTITARDRYGTTRSPNSVVSLSLASGSSTATTAADSTVVALSVSCVSPCTGSGLTATYTASGSAITLLTITDPGYGYDPLHPPNVTDPIYAPSAAFSVQLGAEGYQLFAARLQGSQDPGGLSATYYDAADLTSSPLRSTLVDGPIDFSDSCGATGLLPSGTTPCASTISCLTSGEDFSIRWSGFVSPSLGLSEYTFTASLQGTDERVRLWIDSSLLIDSWTSLIDSAPSATWAPAVADVLYDVKVDYMEGSGTEGFALKWEAATISQVKHACTLAHAL